VVNDANGVANDDPSMSLLICWAGPTWNNQIDRTDPQAAGRHGILGHNGHNGHCSAVMRRKYTGDALGHGQAFGPDGTDRLPLPPP
jgi:hypothetical protein